MGRQRKSLSNEVGNVPMNDGIRRNVFRTVLNALCFTLVCALLSPLEAQADAVFVCTKATAFSFQSCAFPSQWRLRDAAAVTNTNRVLYCPAGTSGNEDVSACPGVRWTTKPRIPAQGLVGVCFGAAGGSDAAACDISSGGGEGWQLKSVVFGAGAPPPAPTLTFTADPTTVANGAAATLSWSSTNATSCTAAGGWSGSTATSGSQSTGALTGNTTFALACTGAGGSISRSVTVSVTPVSTSALAVYVCTNASATSIFSCSYPSQWVLKNPPDISNTEKILLCPGATRGPADIGECSSASWMTKPNVPDSGPIGVCFGAVGGGSIAACTVNAGGGEGWELKSVVFGAGGSTPPAPALTLTANPTSVASGAASTLTWNGTNVTSCTASGAWSGAKAVSGSQSTGALTTNSTFTLSCTGSGGSVSGAATVAVTAAPLAPTLTLTASPTSITSGSSSTLNWSSTNATSCTASGAWSGSKAISGSQSTGALTSDSTFSLNCSGTGGSIARSVTVTITATPPAPTLTFTANPTTVSNGGASTLTWNTTNATSCIAIDGWSGSKPISGSQSTGALTAATTFSLGCGGNGGMVSQSVTVTVAAEGAIFGLEFPGDGAVRRMLYWHNPFPIYDATYIFKVYPRQKTSGRHKYYTTFFWGNDGTFWWDGSEANTYYGAHPYPIPAPDGPGQWEISVHADDPTTGSEVDWNRWHTQAFRAWRESATVTHHEFYYDLPDTSKVITYRVSDPGWASKNPPIPAIVMGQAPNVNGESWGGYPGWEEFNGVIRGIQIYSGLLSVTDIQAEIANPKSTVAGQNLIWYLNVNPRPSDVTDKKDVGTPHHPSWDGSTALEWSE